MKIHAIIEYETQKNGTFFRKLNLNLKVNSDPETIGLQADNFYH